MFSRVFSGFGIFTLVIGDLLPNQALYQTEPHPDKYFVFPVPIYFSAQNIITQHPDFVNIVLQKTFFATTKFSHFAVALVIAHPFMI